MRISKAQRERVSKLNKLHGERMKFEVEVKEAELYGKFEMADLMQECLDEVNAEIASMKRA